MIGGNHNNNKRMCCVEKDDTLSKLPEHLIESILERLPIEDAVRTSVLSRNWRYRWTTMRSLILDEHFSNKLAANNGGAFGYNNFIRVTNQLFNFLEGPILKVYLHIPKEMFLDDSCFQEVNQWIFSLSSRRRNGRVRELVLINNLNQPYQLPSHLFHCSELRKLHLKNSIFKPLSEDFHGFLYLKDLSLAEIEFGGRASDHVIELPRLSKLELLHCTNVYNFNISATRLASLRVEGCHDAMFSRLLHMSRRLTAVHIYIGKPIPRSVETTLNLATMLTSLPYLAILVVDQSFLKFCIAEKMIPNRLPRAAAKRLKELFFLNFNYCDLDQLQCALFMLRNSPNLERLYLMHPMNWGVDRQHLHLDVKPALAYLEASSDCFDQRLSRLKTINTEWVAGSRPFLLLIKILLAHSPTLEMMSIRYTIGADDREKSRIYRNVIRFPRASSKAKIRFTDL